MIKDISVTSMSHHPLSSLSSAAFDDLCAEAYDGSSFYCSFDQFRRLYNDAVESMLAYKDIAQSLDCELEEARSHIAKLENALREFADPDD